MIKDSSDGSDGFDKYIKVFIVIFIAGVGSLSFYLGYFYYSSISGLSYSELLVSPSENGENKIVELIDNANKSIFVEVYLFTNKRLANSLVDAKGRGIDVKVLIDGKMTGGGVDEVIAILEFNGVDVKKSFLFKTTHAKFAVFDKNTVVFGSHNWTNSAFSINRELSIIINNEYIATQLTNLFNNDWSNSE